MDWTRRLLDYDVAEPYKQRFVFVEVSTVDKMKTLKILSNYLLPNVRKIKVRIW